MCQIDHEVILEYYGQNKVLQEGNTCVQILMGLLAQLRREKKTSMHFESSIISYESISSITKKLSSWSLYQLSLYSMTHLGWKTTFIGLVNETRKVKSIDLETVKIGPSNYKLYHFEPTCIPLGLIHLLPFSKYIKCVYQINSI